MPQGGGSTSNTGNHAAGEGASQQIFRLIREGVSWSGLERNTCFLSTGTTGRFTNISKASGFDFPDDGRALILTDWDGDGDLDTFTSNRNAPQIRFLRNDIPTGGNHGITLRLTAPDTVNRDAIGTRVTLELEGQPPVSRTLRAGDGFQAQASKTLHFGLGSATTVGGIAVVWPDGTTERFSGVATGRLYEIHHGRKEPVLVDQKHISWPVPIPSLASVEPQVGARAMIGSELPFPEFSYESFGGETRSSQPGYPLLLNLWASWCVPCLAELKEFHAARERFEGSGLKVLALSVDGIDGMTGDPQKALSLKNEIAPYFETGIASTEVVSLVRILHDLLFEKRGDLVVPTSILIGSDGNVAGYFEGAASPGEILEALTRSESPDRWDYLPFPGRWLAEPHQFRVSEYGNRLLDHGFHDAAVDVYRSRDWSENSGTGFERFLSRAGTGLEDAGDPAGALPYFVKLAGLRANDPAAQFQLAEKLMAAGRFDGAANYFRKTLDLDPSDLPARYNLGIMLNRLGSPSEAIAEFEKVVALDPGHVMALANCAAYHIQQRDPGTAIGYLERALAGKPDFHQARFQLGRLHEAVGDMVSAKREYEKLLELEPGNTAAAARLMALTSP